MSEVKSESSNETHCQDDEVVDNKAMQVTKFDREGKGVFLKGFPDNEILIGIK